MAHLKKVQIMAHYRRSYIEGGTYFFTLVTYKRRTFLTSEEARHSLKTAWIKIRKKYPFDLVAFCLLPDHLHCIWTLPLNDAIYSIRWQGIKGLFSKNMNLLGHWNKIQNTSMKKKRESGYLQRRFWEHTIFKQEDFNRHFDYIHFNPVKHGFVKHPKDWPWSTFHKYVETGIYDDNWGTLEPEFLKTFQVRGE